MERLWAYAVDVYSRPGIADLCLHLQDNYGTNTTILLFANWLQAKSVALTPERVQAARDLAYPWDAGYVQILRRLRRNMKVDYATQLEQVAGVREQIKAAELSAEKLELEWLEALSSQWPPSAINKCNAAIYLASLRVPELVIAEVVELFAKA